MKSCCGKGPTPGVEASATPDEPDVLDAGDVVEGVGVGGLRRPRRVRRVGWWFLWWIWDSGRPRQCQSLWLVLPNIVAVS